MKTGIKTTLIHLGVLSLYVLLSSTGKYYTVFAHLFFLLHMSILLLLIVVFLIQKKTEDRLSHSLTFLTLFLIWFIYAAFGATSFWEWLASTLK